MSAQTKRLVFALALIIAIIAGFYWRSIVGRDVQPQTVASEKPQAAETMRPNAPPSAVKLRYDPLKDPRLSENAAAIYYQHRERMIRAYHGDGQIDKPIEVLRKGTGSRTELLTAMDVVQRQETVTAIPLILKFLEHSDRSVSSSAAETLCWFGDRRGFDFILERARLDGNFNAWFSSLKEIFIEYKPSGYNETLRSLMREVNGEELARRIDAYETGKILAAIGDPASLEVILPMMAKYPPENAEVLLALRNVNDPRVIQAARELLQNGGNSMVKQAAEVVLAAHGDQAARKSIIEAAQRLTGLPQPRNADGTYKPGMEPTSIGAATPAWDGNAVFALEHGMGVVDSSQAVPVLRDIAIHADNVHFSATAIKLLAHIGDGAARNALWDVARSVQAKTRTFEDTLFTATAKALMLFDDETSASLATVMFSGDKHTMEVSRFVAETRGWDGLFKLKLFY